jgi:PAS domain S-box-containing protein
MTLSRQDPQQFLDAALDALASGPDWRPVLDALPVPIYTTDADGAVTYSNRACARFAGREPQPGEDRWCVTWQLYTSTGERLANDSCPMAQAIRERRVIRDHVAIAERPDGTRVAFKPYPTPLFEEDGSLRGAVNMLIDVTDEQCDRLHEHADRCRRLAGATYDRQTSDVLGRMAESFDKTADKLAGKGRLKSP